MPSSTSSSSERAPRGPWLRTWLSAIVVLLIALAVWKVSWTTRGYGLSLPNNPSAWGATRTRLQPESTVLIGTSRIQAGIVPQVWKEETGESPLQLALVGSSPVPILEHIATETDFRGLLIMGIVEMYTFDAEAGSEHARRALSEYHNILTSPSRRAGVGLAKLVPDRVLVRNRQLTFPRVVDALWNGHSPRNLPANMQEDRWMKFDRGNLLPGDLDYHEFDTKGRPATPAERDAVIARIAAAVTTIQARGGTVILVALPSCGMRRRIEERRYPRDEYWQPLTAGTPALAIDAREIRETSEFECADGSHMDESDARRFTRIFARLVENRR